MSHIYASPIFRARTGSTHGYDVVDHNEINPELGGRAAFDSLVEEVHRHGMGWIQDMVPNHMAYAPENPVLVDLFENGEQSRHRDFFDIDWQTPFESLHGRVIAPFLGDLYGEVLNRGELTLRYDESGFAICYYEMHFPLRVETYSDLLAPGIGTLESRLGRDHPEMLKLLGVLYTLESLQTESDPGTRWDKIGFVKRMLWELYRGSREIRRYLMESVDAVNGVAGEPETFTALNELHWKQVYRLSHWKVASEEINYRRFFSINDLICLRIERREVFEHTHRLLFELIDQGSISGLRIDHIDGLYEPGKYLSWLRERIGERPIYVEKILHPGETLPEHWPVDGTTGYDTLNALNGLFVDRAASRRIRSFYRSFAGVREEYELALQNRKRQILEAQMHGDLDNLTRYMRRVVSDDRYGIDITAPSLRRALGEVMVNMPVYRTYVTDKINRPTDREYIDLALTAARKRLPHHDYELDYIESFLLLTYTRFVSEESKQRLGDVVLRFQQFTGPLMAKGLEDTLMYGYLPLLSVNEVGGSPEILGGTARDFHAGMRRLAERHPRTMTASSTHDTKRGEDTRLRIDAISRYFDAWSKAVREWRSANKSLRRRVGRSTAPDANDEYLIYQTLVGILAHDAEVDDALESRMQEYVTKALREAKRHTSWNTPDAPYEEAALAFLTAVLQKLRSGGRDRSGFTSSFRAFLRLITPAVEADIVAHQVIRLTIPGVPDVYQGTELPDLTLVDPDNRRPVDWALRQAALKELEAWTKAIFTGEAGVQPGDQRTERIDLTKIPLSKRKMAVMHLLLELRARHPELFRSGSYVPLSVTGCTTEEVLAFARLHEDTALITVASRRGKIEDDLALPLPYELAPGTYLDLLSGSSFFSADSELPLGDSLAAFPALVLWRVSG